MMTNGIVTVRVLLMVSAGAGLAGTAYAQPAGGVDPRPAADRELVEQLSTMEAVLAQTVSRSARRVEQQLPSSLPGVVLFAGPTQVRGFRLVDYGVFFDVEYPALRRSILWSMQMLESDLEADLRLLRHRIERLAGLPSLEQLWPADALDRLWPAEADTDALRPSAARRAFAGGRRVGSDPGRPGRRPPADAPPVRLPDPGDQYRAELRRELVDVVLRRGGTLARMLAPDEWLTVTARDVRGHRENDLTLRVKARDVVAVQEGVLAVAAARARVDTSPF